MREAASDGPAAPGADVVVVDFGEASARRAAEAIAGKLARPGRVLVTVKPAEGDLPPGVVLVPGGKLVDEIVKLCGPAQGAPTRTSTAAPAAAPAEAATNIEQIIQLKIAKVRELRARGIDPFPHRFDKKNAVNDVNERAEGVEPSTHTEHEVVTAGRVTAHRAMGRAIFFDIQDGSGKAQVYVHQQEQDAGVFALAQNDIQIGDFVGVRGKVFMTKTSQPTVAAEKLWILAKALRPLPEKWHGLKDPETRYRQRHLDLISNPEARRLAVERSRIVESIRRTMGRLRYLEVETPILLAQAGGATAKPFETHHNALDARMYMRIATELHLKRLIVGGLERVYEIGRIFRNEGIDTRHNPEFTTLEAYG
ncbi:MAG: OB-fold nucleic acid binding domain-containing protein, partial [Elusimicrobia bacterium]|nr:OB-fold nucleic acid binding domain-containing protein [Elusimicrobiota bacterium]